MKREVHQITGRDTWLELRRRNVNASDVAALFHAHPYTTALELWAIHTGNLEAEDVDSMAMRRGRILESAVAASLRETHPEWVIFPAEEYVEIPALRLGCTPDFYAWPSKDDYVHDRNRFAVQAKTVLEGVYEDAWAASPPAHYLIQIQTEMLVLGLDRVLLAPMVLDSREFPVHEWFFQADPEFHDAIRAQVGKFWRHVDERREPKIKPGQDGATLSRLFPDGQADPALLLHGDGDFVRICAEYVEVRQQIKALEARKDELASQVMNRLRNHAKAEAQDYKVSWTTIPAMVVTQNRKAHRRLVVNKVKGKA